MLVLTRFVGESVTLGDPENPIAFIKVDRIKGQRVRLAIDAPKDIEITRNPVGTMAERRKVAGCGA